MVLKDEHAHTLPSPVGVTGDNPRPKQCRFRYFMQKVTLSVLLGCVLYHSVDFLAPEGYTANLGALTGTNTLLKEQSCPQAGVLRPSKNQDLWSDVTHQIASKEFRNQAVGWLSGAVQVP